MTDPINYGWTFEQVMLGTQSGTLNDIIHDGRDVWVATTTSVRKYSYWDQRTEYEYLDESYYFTRNTNALPGETYLDPVDGIVPALRMCVWGDHVYLLGTNKQTLKVVNKHTMELVATLTVPQPCTSLAAGYNKLWLCSEDAFENDQQRLYYYDLIAETWNYSELDGKKDLIGPRAIADGLDGFMLITARNEHSLLKYNGTTGAFVSSTRINRHPYKLHVSQDKVAYVVSDPSSLINGGMLTTFDQTTDLPTNISSAGGSVWGIGEDEIQGHVWMLGGSASIARLNLSDSRLIFRPTPTNTPVDTRDQPIDNVTPNGVEDSIAEPQSVPWYPPAPGYTIMLSDWGLDYDMSDPNSRPDDPTKQIQGGLVTPPLYYQRWNGTSFVDVNVAPYVFFAVGASSTRLFAGRATALVRVNRKEVLGTAMVTTGPQNYYGE